MGQSISFGVPFGAPKKKQVVFQLGTNNWQRQGEFAPGSGILHEAHHDCMNSLDNTSCYSVYPSKGQKQSLLAAEEQAFVRIFPLEHDIPICESISPVSSYRWHSMSEEEFTAYRNRLRDFCIAFIDEIEAKEDMPVYFLRVEIGILSNEETFEDCINRICRPRPISSAKRFF